MRTLYFTLLLLAVTATAQAGPIGIQVLDRQHSTHLRATNNVFSDPSGVTRSRQSNDRVFDTLSVPGQTAEYPGPIIVEASADLFDIYVYGSNATPQSATSANARTYFEFMTLSDVVAPITLDFSGAAQSYWSSGSVSLFDLTAGAAVWEYEWISGFSGSVPWMNRSGGGFEASLAPSTPLLLDNHYAFSMSMTTQGQEAEVQDLRVRLSGIHDIPEPSTVALLLAAFAAGAYRARHR